MTRHINPYWDSLYQQILFNDKILRNEYCHYNEGILFNGTSLFNLKITKMNMHIEIY